GRAAGPDGALAAEGGAPEERDRRAALGRGPCAGLAGRAAADDDDVVLPAHVGSSSPACSATMYAAYQSGQFSSPCPVRFSCSPWAADARRIAFARSATDAYVVSAASIRPGSRVVTSC